MTKTPSETLLTGFFFCVILSVCDHSSIQRPTRGIESKGMILMAKQIDGKMRIVTPEERLTNGATIG